MATPTATHGKKPKSKMEETQAFLDELAADFPEPAATGTATTTTAGRTTTKGGKKKLTGGGGREKSKDSVGPAEDLSPSASTTIERSATPRLSNDVPSPAGRASTESITRVPPPAASTADPEADLAFLEAQLAAARRPAGSRPATPATAGTGTGKATIGAVLQAPTGGRKSVDSNRSQTSTPVNEASPAAGAGWGSSWWTSASTILSTAKTVAIEQVAQVARQADEVQSTARKVAVEGAGTVQKAVGAAGSTGLNLEAIAQKGGMGLQQLREQLGDRVKGVDLERFRHDWVQRGQSALVEIMNTVAPPISEHEVVQVWFSHDMKGYDGVESVVYTAVESIMRQTSSTDLELFYSSPARTSTGSTASRTDPERSINPVLGWDRAWEKTGEMLTGIKERMKDDPRRGHENPDLPVLTIPVYLHLQPVLAPLPFPEPSTHAHSSPPAEKPNHLTFLITLHDDVHSLRFSTVSQYCPGDWLDVPYEVSDWVEERLVEVLRVGVEGIVQEYVATRMNLKQVEQADVAAPALSTNDDEKAGVDATAEEVEKDAAPAEA